MLTSTTNTACSAGFPSHALRRRYLGAPVPESAHPTSQRLDRRVWIVAGVVILGVVMSLLDTTIVNVALATLGRDLHSPVATIQWVSAGYLVSLALVIPLAGWLVERFGTRRVWMLAVAAFGAGSALCGMAGSAGWLIFFRVLQGLGGGLIMPVGMTLIAQTAGPGRVGRVMAVAGVPMLLGPILGSALGGLIVSNASWRWIFYVNVPLVAAALILARSRLPRDRGSGAGPFDWIGFCLLSPGLVGIVVGLSELQSHGGIGAPIALTPLLTGIVLTLGFVGHSARARRPLIDVRLFRSPGFSAAAATTFLLGAALFGAMLVIALYYQVGRGRSALGAGLLMAPQGIGAALAMPLAGRLTDRVGSGRVVLAGVIGICAGTLGFVHAGPHTPFALLSVSLVIRGLGLGAAMMPAMAGAYATLRPEQVPRATSALNAIQRVGGSIGTAVLAVVLQHQLTSGHGMGAAALGTPGAPHPATAFAHTFWWALGLSLLALVPALTLAIVQAKADKHARQTVPRSSAAARAHAIGRPIVSSARRVALDTDQP